MGYSHYFAYDPAAASFRDAWPRMVCDARLIAAHVQSVLGIHLAGGAGEGQPEITERRIWLNGPFAGDLAHGTLLIDPAPWRTWEQQGALCHRDCADLERRPFVSRGFVAAFCKTARKPYELAVASILLRCRHLAPDAFVIASDGDWRQDWYRCAPDTGRGWRPAPVEVVAALFSQLETASESRLLPEVWDGPGCARGPQDTAEQRNAG